MSLITELSRRNVFRVTIAYGVAGWLLVEIGDVVLGTFGAPAWVLKTVIALLLLGLPAVVFFAWAFEVTPEGIKREHEVQREESITRITGRKLDRTIIVMLVIALGYFAFDKFVLAPEREAAMVEEASRVAAEAVEQSAIEKPAAEPVVAAQPDNSIAVLPFIDMSPESNQAYFSDGLSEELLNLLAKIPNLRVAARTSSFSFKGQNLEIPEIAARLNVAHVLEGSVRKAGDQVRITAQLVQAKDGYHQWSETYDRKLDNIFAIQDEIAAAVVDALKVRLLGAAPSAAETDPGAYALYLQAREIGRQGSEEGFERSNAFYRQVLETDPDYAPAWGGLALNISQQVSVGFLPQRENLEMGRDAAERAIQIDPQFALGHAIVGNFALKFDNDLLTAAEYIERAAILEPGNIEVLRIVATLYRSLGRLEEALQVVEYMVRLDPVNVDVWYNLGLMQDYLGHFDEAITSYERAVNLSPNRVTAWAMIAEALMFNGQPEQALAAVANENSVWRDIELPMIYHALGRQADSDAALEKLIEEYPQEAAYNIAYIYAFRGEADPAFDWLERAIDTADPGLTDILVDRPLDNIRNDPRWLPLLERLGRAPDQLDAIEFEFRPPD